MLHRSKLLGLSAIALAIGFNLPYARLVAIYDYPDILRRPAGEALQLFVDGGASLVITWHAFAVAALLFIPLSLGLSLSPTNLHTSQRLSIAAAITGSLSGMAQAIGLWRWVFVVPELARIHQSGAEEAKAAAEASFSILNAYGGVAIGEHLGQWLLVMFVLSLSILQWRQLRRTVAAVGYSTALATAIGTTEGVAIALGRDAELFSIFTIVGFVGFTLWLILTGLGELVARRVMAIAALDPLSP